MLQSFGIRRMCSLFNPLLRQNLIILHKDLKIVQAIASDLLCSLVLDTITISILLSILFLIVGLLLYATLCALVWNIFIYVYIYLLLKEFARFLGAKAPL